MKLSEIHTNPANPRLIKDDRFKKLVKSIDEFPIMMELRPIIIDSEGMILGGNMRFKALKEIGYKELPEGWVRRADSLTDEEKRRFIIADNVGFGSWDELSLLEAWSIDELTEWGLEIEDKPKPEGKEINLTPFNQTHVLISFPPEKLSDIEDLLLQLKNKSFIEYEQSSN